MNLFELFFHSKENLLKIYTYKKNIFLFAFFLKIYKIELQENFISCILYIYIQENEKVNARKRIAKSNSKRKCKKDFAMKKEKQLKRKRKSKKTFEKRFLEIAK